MPLPSLINLYDDKKIFFNEFSLITVCGNNTNLFL